MKTQSETCQRDVGRDYDSGPAELFRLEVLICTVTVSLGKGPHIIKLKFNVTVKGAAERRGRRAGPVT